MAERNTQRDKSRSVPPETKSESTVTAPSPLNRLTPGDHLDAAPPELKRKGQELRKFSEEFTEITESINQLIPPAGCAPPTAADLLKSKQNYPTKEVDACKPVEYAATASSEKKEDTPTEVETKE